LSPIRDVVTAQQHFAVGRLEDPGQEVDERRLARAVRANERMSRPRLQTQIDVAHGSERAKGHTETARLEQQLAHELPRDADRRVNISARPRIPFLAKSAITTSRSPSPSCQAVG